jgi:hypothetical protein
VRHHAMQCRTMPIHVGSFAEWFKFYNNILMNRMVWACSRDGIYPKPIA